MRKILVVLAPLLLFIPIGTLNLSVIEEENCIDLCNLFPNEIEGIDANIIGDFFTGNLGQKSVGAGSYYAEGYPLSVGFGCGWAAYYLINQDNTSDNGGVLFRTYFIDCNQVEPIGVDPLFHRNNYFIGNDPDKWVTGAKNFREVWYWDLWDGIDLRYYFKDGMLKYDLIIGPGSDPNDINIRIEGHDSLSIGDNGDLVIGTGIGNVKDSGLIAFYGRDRSSIVSCDFTILDENIFSFRLGPYDRSEEIVIDPQIYFSTYIGGHAYDACNDIALDKEGNIYVIGTTSSSDFPSHGDSYMKPPIKEENDNDPSSYLCEYMGRYIFIIKLTPDGNVILFSTFIGGLGAGNEGVGITLDKTNNIYITGITRSNYPITTKRFGIDSGSLKDVVISVLSTNGDKLLHSTVISGTWDDYSTSIALDKENNIYVIGETDSGDFPTTKGSIQEYHNTPASMPGTWYQDAFILKLTSNCSEIVYSTLFGGRFAEVCNDISIDEKGDAYITGSTTSFDFPTTKSAFDVTYDDTSWDAKIHFDAFITKINSKGTEVIFSTFIGGSYDDWGKSIYIDELKNVYITGGTESYDFPTTYGSYQNEHNDQSFKGDGYYDAFFCMINPNGSSLLYSTFIGGKNGDWGSEIIVDMEKNVYIVGCTYSDDFPVINGSYNTNYCDIGIEEEFKDLFAIKFNINENEMKYSSFIGGWKDEYCMGFMIDSQGNGVIVGHTTSDDFVKTEDGYELNYHDDESHYQWSLIGDGFILKIAYELDTDNDKLTDNEELSIGTDPTNPDSDEDGMPDGWEVRYGLDPLFHSSHLDTDEDGRNDLDEYKTNSNPLIKDNEKNHQFNNIILIIFLMMMLIIIIVSIVAIIFYFIKRRVST